MSYIYVAGPYSHEDANVREQRYIALNNFTLWLAFYRQLTPYSPITHWHEIAKANTLPTEFEFWTRVNHDMLKGASAIYLLMLDGWDKSRGVKYEIELAKNYTINVFNWQ